MSSPTISRSSSTASLPSIAPSAEPSNDPQALNGVTVGLTPAGDATTDNLVKSTEMNFKLSSKNPFIEDKEVNLEFALGYNGYNAIEHNEIELKQLAKMGAEIIQDLFNEVDEKCQIYLHNENKLTQKNLKKFDRLKRKREALRNLGSSKTNYNFHTTYCGQNLLTVKYDGHTYDFSVDPDEKLRDPSKTKAEFFKRIIDTSEVILDKSLEAYAKNPKLRNNIAENSGYFAVRKREKQESGQIQNLFEQTVSREQFVNLQKVVQQQQEQLKATQEHSNKQANALQRLADNHSELKPEIEAAFKPAAINSTSGITDSRSDDTSQPKPPISL